MLSRVAARRHTPINLRLEELKGVPEILSPEYRGFNTQETVMQKKLIAVAMAGAFGAPALALAQTSTVQIYGTVNMEYGYVDAGNARGPLGASAGGARIA